MTSLMTVHQSEIMDKCEPEVWFNLYNSGTLKMVEDAFVVGGRIVSKYFLHTQKEDRWAWLMQFGNHDDYQYTFLSEMFAKNGINTQEFAQNVFAWLNCTHRKKNCLFFHGPPNTGKTLIAQLLTSVFMSGTMSLKGITSDFYYEPILNKSVAVLEELWVVPQVADDFKTLFSGQELHINKKHCAMQKLGRTPIIVTSNHSRFGRGFLSGVDENALQNRCYTYNFKYDISDLASCDVTVPAFAHWLLINYECGSF